MGKRLRTAFIVATVLALSLVAASYLYLQRSSRAPAKVALATARTSPQFQQSIGEPARIKFITTGSILEKDGDGNADLLIPVSGPKGQGKLAEWAQENGGKWHICSLDLLLNNGAERITIVEDANTSCERE